MAIPFGSLLVLVLLLFISPSSAEIRFRAIDSNDHLIIPLDLFGFTDSGRVELNVSSFSLSNPNADFSKLSFFLTSRSSWLHVVRQLENSEISCPIDSDLLRIVFSFRQLHNASNNVHSSFSAVYSVPGDGRYHLVFGNCVPGLRVSMNVHSALYNLQGDRRDYLPAGTIETPRVYSILASIYFAISLCWMSFLCLKRRLPSAVHLMVFMFLIVKAFNLLCEADAKANLNRTGISQFKHLWISIILKLPLLMFPQAGVMSFGQIEFIGSGPNAGLINWEAQFLLVEAIFFSAVLLAIQLWIKSLRGTAKIDIKVAKKMTMLQAFRNYCAVVFCYMYATTAVVYALEVITSYRYLWTSVAATELITLIFYASLGYKFRHYYGLCP